MTRKVTAYLVGCSALILGWGLTQPMTVTTTTAQAKTAKVVHHKKKAKKAKKAKKKVSAKVKRQRAEKKAFTKAQRKEIAGYRHQANKISDTTKGMYAQKPKLKKTFRPGKLSAKYVNATVDWINLYRKIFDLTPVTNDAGWNQDAQYGAATLAAADKGLSHGLEGIKKPGFVATAAWKRGADATDHSNLMEGAVSPFDNVAGYLNDSNNISTIVPGHREWILGDISRVGVGQAGEYNDLKVIEDQYTDHSPKTVAVPRAGVSPVGLVNDGAPWSISYADEYDGDGTKPKVKVYDQTKHKTVKVSKVGITSDGYGWFGTTVYFVPKASQVKVNHAYRVTVSQIGGQADVQYTTKLFKLNV